MSAQIYIHAHIYTLPILIDSSVILPVAASIQVQDFLLLISLNFITLHNSSCNTLSSGVNNACIHKIKFVYILYTVKENYYYLYFILINCFYWIFYDSYRFGITNSLKCTLCTSGQVVTANPLGMCSTLNNFKCK